MLLFFFSGLRTIESETRSGDSERGGRIKARSRKKNFLSLQGDRASSVSDGEKRRCLEIVLARATARPTTEKCDGDGDGDGNGDGDGWRPPGRRRNPATPSPSEVEALLREEAGGSFFVDGGRRVQCGTCGKRLLLPGGGKSRTVAGMVRYFVKTHFSRLVGWLGGGIENGCTAAAQDNQAIGFCSTILLGCTSLPVRNLLLPRTLMRIPMTSSL